MEKIILSKRQKEIITALNIEPYTPEYLEVVLNENKENIYVNASKALQQTEAYGFYLVIQAAEKAEVVTKKRRTKKAEVKESEEIKEEMLVND